MPSRAKSYRAETATPDQRRLIETISNRVKTSSKTAPAMRTLLGETGELRGPPQLWILNPAFGEIFNSMAVALQTSLQLSPKSREIAILMTAQRVNSDFEWKAHEGAAIALGMEDAAIEALRRGEIPDLADDEQTAVARLSAEMLDTGTVEEKSYLRELPTLGERGIFETAVVVGFYRALALQLSTFDVD